jgi:hypothetical protein
MIRLLRLFKILQIAKKSRVAAGHVHKTKINHGTERLIFFSFGFGLLIHLFGCIFVILS